MQIEGVVKKISTKTGKGRGGKAWTLYSFVLGLDDGSESEWITFGFDKEPPFEEGDRVNVGAESDKNGYLKYKEGSGRIVSTKPVGSGAATGVSEPQPAARAGTEGAAAPSAISPRAVAEDTRQRQIVAQHSQEMAIGIVGLLLQHNGLPVTGAQTKAGEAKRFEEIVAAVDKFTIKFHNDVVTGRLNATVADMGVVSVMAKDAIPPADAKKTGEKTAGADDYG